MKSNLYSRTEGLYLTKRNVVQSSSDADSVYPSDGYILFRRPAPRVITHITMSWRMY